MATIPAHVNRVLLFTAVTNELLKRAQAHDQEKAAQAVKIGALAKKAAELLAKHDRIETTQIEKVAVALGNHDQSLTLLAELAQHRNAHELGRSTAAEKSASERLTPRRQSDAPIANYDDTPEGQRFRQHMLG
jgi:hypothetical protein